MSGLVVAVAFTAATTFPANADPVVATLLTGTVSQTTVDSGQPVVISGRISKQTDTGWADVSAALIRVYRCDFPTCTEIRTTQSMMGGWQVTYYPVRAQSYRAVFDPSGSTSTAHLAPSSVDLPQVNVRHTSRTSITAAERLSSGDVRIRGYVTFGSYFIAPDLPPVRIEFSPDSIGWTPVTTVPSTYLYVGGYAYEALLPQPSSGYWKAVYDGSPTYAKASTSTTVYVG